MSINSLLSFPSEIILLICEHVIRHKLDKSGIIDLYHIGDKIEPMEPVRPYYTSHMVLASRLYLGDFNRIYNRRNERLGAIRQLRLVCKRFARIIPRPPPDYLRVVSTIYRETTDGECHRARNNSLKSRPSWKDKHDCSSEPHRCLIETKDDYRVLDWYQSKRKNTYEWYVAIILGILYAFLCVKFATRTEYWPKKLTINGMVINHTPYGAFNLEYGGSSILIHTPFGSFECYNHGIYEIIYNDKVRSDALSIKLDEIIDRCRALADTSYHDVILFEFKMCQ
jgi:hypothetical protein